MIAGTYNHYNTLLRVTESQIFGDAGSSPLLGMRGAPVPPRRRSGRKENFSQVFGPSFGRVVEQENFNNMFGPRPGHVVDESNRGCGKEGRYGMEGPWKGVGLWTRAQGVQIKLVMLEVDIIESRLGLPAATLLKSADAGLPISGSGMK